MTIIKALGHLKLQLGFKEKHIRLEHPKKVRELIEHEKLNLKRVAILVNQKPGTLDTLVSDEDELVLLPEIGGGIN